MKCGFWFMLESLKVRIFKSELGQHRLVLLNDLGPNFIQCLKIFIRHFLRYYGYEFEIYGRSWFFFYFITFRAQLFNICEVLHYWSRYNRLTIVVHCDDCWYTLSWNVLVLIHKHTFFRKFRENDELSNSCWNSWGNWLRYNGNILELNCQT